MGREHEIRFLLSAMLLDALVIVLLFLGLTALRQSFPEWWPFDLFPGNNPVLPRVGTGTVSRQFLPLLLPIVPLWIGALAAWRAYQDLRHTPPPAQLVRVTAGVVSAFLVLLVLLWSVQKAALVSRIHIVAFATLSVPALWASHRFLCATLRWTRLGDLDVANIVLLGHSDDVVPLARSIEAHPDWGFRTAGQVVPAEEDLTIPTPLPILGHLERLSEVLLTYPIHKVIMTGQDWDLSAVKQAAEVCEDLGVRFGLETRFVGFRSGLARLEGYGDHSVLVFSRTPMDGLSLLVKRAMDVAGASLALILLSPILAVTALAIKLQDGGPILFVQQRSGLYGRTFPLFKFRTMVVDAEARRKELEAMNEMSGPVFKIKRDPRITAIGAFLRKTSIDEFPQFWNVLRGEMSLVGPRPPIPKEVDQYERWQVRRLSMKPGITCIWQVSGRNEVGFESWMKMDLEYIDNWSLWLDVKLLLLTVPAVLSARGAR